jgi:hypothetical protein
MFVNAAAGRAGLESGNHGGNPMRRRWLLIAVCAVTIQGIRGWSGRSAEAAGLIHVAEYAGGAIRANTCGAQYRYLHSQPHHWRQCLIKN